MEIVILISLLMIFVLLLQDKIVSKRKKKSIQEEIVNPHLPDIMGQPKLPARQIHHQDIIPKSLDIEYGENENIEIPPEERDGVFNNTPDFYEEEEEWFGNETSADKNGFATGVTFEELSHVGALLQNDSTDFSQKELAVATVEKIQGTELFSLLEISIEGASRKIAELLDAKLSNETDTGSSTLLRDDFEGFDIGQFV